MLAPFEKGDRVRIVTRIKQLGVPTQEIIFATINWAEVRIDREGGQFVYFGYTPEDYHFGKWGYAGLHFPPKPFGVQEVVSLGKQRYMPEPYGHNINLYRHPAYDLIHDPDPKWSLP